jgi:hypothetical protein
VIIVTDQIIIHDEALTDEIQIHETVVHLKRKKQNQYRDDMKKLMTMLCGLVLTSFVLL